MRLWCFAQLSTPLYTPLYKGKAAGHNPTAFILDIIVFKKIQ
jgi:hypothetical protein